MACQFQSCMSRRLIRSDASMTLVRRIFGVNDVSKTLVRRIFSVNDVSKSIFGVNHVSKTYIWFLE